MTRQTSIQAFQTIKDEGLLSDRRWKVYEAIFNAGEMNRNEVAAVTGMLPSAASARLSELRELGCVYETGEKPCAVTGHKLIHFDVTANLPGKLERRRTKGQITKDILDCSAKIVKAWREKWPQEKKLEILEGMERLGKELNSLMVGA